MMIDLPVIGLDTASSRLHWVASQPLWSADADALAEPAAYGWCQCPKDDADGRRRELYEHARQFFRSLPERGACVFCEEPLALAKNGKTTRLLGLAAGAIWAAHLDYNVTWFWVDVASWKKSVVGRGNASKDDVAAFCLNDPGFRQEFMAGVGEPGVGPAVFVEQPDLYDAWCLKTYGVQQLAGAL
jgi:Holliday junction resolvasome RuvABC endonuclease subunit